MGAGDRMLEAAMLGIPYEGRIPAFAADNDVQPTSPSVLAQRQLREEQDNAFQQSLQVAQCVWVFLFFLFLVWSSWFGCC